MAAAAAAVGPYAGSLPSPLSAGKSIRSCSKRDTHRSCDLMGILVIAAEMRTGQKKPEKPDDFPPRHQPLALPEKELKIGSHNERKSPGGGTTDGMGGGRREGSEGV